ncbi:MAG: glutamine-hydrolyzing carbamoyl-phosphate synthase small subunit [Chlamydiota bacterium]
MEWLPSRLVLQNDEVYTGLSPDWQKDIFCGEVVFTTGMTGYVESLTDPSFAGQILVFTYPLIGNYGVPKKELWESLKVHARGVVMNEISPFFSHHEAEMSLLDFLRSQNVPLITQVDTRTLTRRLRSNGVTLGAITHAELPVNVFTNYHECSLVKEVSIKEPLQIGSGEKTIIAVDCGMKENIIRCLQKFPITIKRVPWDYDYSEENFDGVFLSNGPGNPAECQATIEILKKALEKKKPVFGICLGAQILSLAIGASTYKLLYGHRGQNQPCVETTSERCFLTSQNHGYAVDATSLPEGWKVSFRNLNDNSVEGIEHLFLPFFAVQFHPEAAPGPTDTSWLFDKFYEMINQ